MVASTSLARRRLPLIQAKKRSTTHPSTSSDTMGCDGRLGLNLGSLLASRRWIRGEERWPVPIPTRPPLSGSLISTIVVAFELSRAKWLIGVCLPGSDKLSRYTIDAGDLGALTAVLAEARRKVAARCPGAVVAIASC